MVRTGRGKTHWFKIWKGNVKAVYCYTTYLTSMQRTSGEIQGWVKHKLKSKLSGEISTTSDVQTPTSDTTLMAESEEELKSFQMNVKEESEKADLKLSIQKTDYGIQSHHFMANRWKNNGNSDGLFSWAPK